MLPHTFHHPYAGIFVIVLAEQLGAPIPALPVLLAAGAIAGAGEIHWLPALGWAVLAAVLADFVWYGLGRTKGKPILRTLCRISLEPDSCVRQTENVYARYGMGSLLFAKFVPGLSTIAPPLAGIFRLTWWRFLLLDGLGAAIWAGVYLAAGLLFRKELTRLGGAAEGLGSGFIALLVAFLAIYIGVKYWQRRRLRKDLNTIERITPQDLRQRLQAGEPIFLLDVRKRSEWTGDRLPGAILISPDELEAPKLPFPDGGVLVLYCWCPNEVSSARAALRLRQRGFLQAHVLEGGFERWRDLGFPIQPSENES